MGGLKVVLSAIARHWQSPPLLLLLWPVRYGLLRAVNATGHRCVEKHQMAGSLRKRRILGAELESKGDVEIQAPTLRMTGGIPPYRP